MTDAALLQKKIDLTQRILRLSADTLWSINVNTYQLREASKERLKNPCESTIQDEVEQAELLAESLMQAFRGL